MMPKSPVVRSHAVPFATVTFAEDAKHTSKQSSKRNFASEAELDLLSLDGLRAIACLAVICFHCLMYWGLLLDWKTGNEALDNSFILRIASNGNIGVDVFLVLTGLLATTHLVPALQQACKADLPSDGIWNIVRRYFRKRVYSIVPPYITTLLLVVMISAHAKDPELQRNKATVMNYCPQALPLNFLFLNNFAGFAGCGTLFWSLAVQVHFFAAFPFLLLSLNPRSNGFRRRVAVIARNTFIASAFLRWGMAHLFNSQLPLPAYAHQGLTSAMASAAVRYYHPLYFNTFARLGNLATGVLIGLALTSPTLKKTPVNSKQQQHLRSTMSTILLNTATAVSLATLACFLLGNKLYGVDVADDALKQHNLVYKYGKAFAAFAYHGSPLYCIAVAGIILTLVLHANPISTMMAKLLNSMPVTHIGKLSYHFYLMHMVAVYWWEALVLPNGFIASITRAHPLRGYLFILGGTLVMTYKLALAHWWVHEYVVKRMLYRKQENGAAIDVKPKYT